MSGERLGVVRFPGTNCDRDTFNAAKTEGFEPVWLWHEDQFDASSVDRIIVPGGFSYGDYLRTGALASRSPVMKSIHEASKKGTPILGVCNGFQILCESGLLPGVLVQNVKRRFIDEWCPLEVQSPNPHWGSKLIKGQELQLPIAHGEGRFYAEDNVLKALADKDQIWLRYRANPNGSLRDIAGIMNDKKNVVGLMPHPERALKAWMGGVDGVGFFH